MLHQEAQIVSATFRSLDNGQTNYHTECAKRWQQSLDPDLDRSEWRESEVGHLHILAYSIDSFSWLTRLSGQNTHRSNTAIGKALEGYSTGALSRSIKELYQESVSYLQCLSMSSINAF